MLYPHCPKHVYTALMLLPCLPVLCHVFIMLLYPFDIRLFLVVCITEQSGTGRQGEGGESGGGVLLRCVLLLAAVSTGEAMLVLYLCPTFSFIRDWLGGVTD